MSGVLFEQSVLSIDAIHDGDNLSDHEPVVMKLCLESKYVRLTKKIHLDKIAWHKAKAPHLSNYIDRLLSVATHYAIMLNIASISIHTQIS